MQRMQLRLRHPLHHPHIFAVRIHSQRDAREHRPPIDLHPTSTTIPLFAPLLRPDQIEPATEDLELRPVVRRRNLNRLPVDGHLQQHDRPTLAHPAAPANPYRLAR